MSAQVISRVFEGTWEELQQHGDELAGKHVRLEVIADQVSSEAPDKPAGKGLTFGMFPVLRDLDEEDFRAAEWHGEDLELA